MEYVMLSALQHFAFCPRQCALIHLEQVWQENGHTAEGRLMHDAAHTCSSRMRDGVKVVTDMEMRSERLGLYGRADVVEFHHASYCWQPYPVEYKKGRPHKGCDADEIQLCGQAMCLEEMLAMPVHEGALYYGTTKRRMTVIFTTELRKRTEEMASAVHALFDSGKTPPPMEMPWCKACSLNEWCLPGLSARSASRYLSELCGDTA